MKYYSEQKMLLASGVGRVLQEHDVDKRAVPRRAEGHEMKWPRTEGSTANG